MGACIGKKSSKYLKHDQIQSNITQVPQIKIQDDTVPNKSPSSLSKKLQVTDNLTDTNNDEYRISQIEEISINSELQTILDEQEIINEAFNYPLPSRIVSTTESEFEYELAKLIYENPENNELDILLDAMSIKSNRER